MRLPAFLLLLMGAGGVAGAQEAAERAVVVTEGTNFAVAASPDGTQLVMDLQGTLWLLPAAGGSAEALTDGLGTTGCPTSIPRAAG